MSGYYRSCFHLGHGVIVDDLLIVVLSGSTFLGMVSVVRFLIVISVCFLSGMVEFKFIVYFSREERL